MATRPEESEFLRTRLTEVLGPREADILMRKLPEDEPLTREMVRADIQTLTREIVRSELGTLRTELRAEMASFATKEEFAEFRGEVRVEMRDLMREQTRHLGLLMLGTVITLAGTFITTSVAF